MKSSNPLYPFNRFELVQSKQVFNRRISTKYFAAKRKVQRIFNRRFSPIIADKDSDLHRRDAEYAEEIPFAQSGDDDWAKTYSSNLSNVFVCRRLPTNKNLILCALCPSTGSGSRASSRDASAVIFIKGFLFVSTCVNLRLIAFDALRSARCSLPARFASCFASLRLAPWNTDLTEVELFARCAIPQGEVSFTGFRNKKLGGKLRMCLIDWGSDGG